MARVFISLGGEFPNIGDALIRRLSADWFRGVGDFSAFTASAPDMWLRQVGVAGAERLYRGRRAIFAWVRDLALYRGRPILVLEPGEVVLDRANVRRQAVLLLACAVAKAKGGVVILPPRAVARRVEVRPWGPTVALHRLSCRLADVVLWRDQRSRQHLGIGDTTPDIGFAADLRDGLPWAERNILLVTLRGKRSTPPPEWFDGVRAYCDANSLRITTFAQVRGDEDRAKELAQGLGAEHFPWTLDDLAHEEGLRSLYGQARAVISDRLHVLILSSLSGTVPVELVEDPSEKVRIHFQQIGVRAVSADARGLSAGAVASVLDDLIKPGPPILAVKAAHESLGQWRDRVRDLCRVSPAGGRNPAG